MSLYGSTIQMVQEIISKYIPCQVISLDVSHCAVVFLLSQELAKDYKKQIYNAIEQSCNMLHNYYGVFITSGVGRPVTSPIDIASSYAGAKYSALTASQKGAIIFAEDSCDEGSEPFNMSLYREN